MFKIWFKLVIVVLLAILTGISCIYTLNKYFDLPSLSIKPDVKNFDPVIIVTVLIAFFVFIKEIITIIPIITKELSENEQGYLNEKRKEAAIDIAIDTRKINDAIHVYLYKSVYTEKGKRYLGDKNIGKQYFSDFEHSITLHAKSISRKKMSIVPLDCYSDLPLIHTDLVRYLDVKCHDLINDKPLSFVCNADAKSNHQIEIAIDLNNTYKKGDEFKIQCKFTVPYALLMKGKDYLFSNALYHKIDTHEIEVRFICNPPDFIRLKALNLGKDVEFILQPKIVNDLICFQRSVNGNKKSSNLQLEFTR